MTEDVLVVFGAGISSIALSIIRHQEHLEEIERNSHGCIADDLLRSLARCEWFVEVGLEHLGLVPGAWQTVADPPIAIGGYCLTKSWVAC